MLLHLLGAVLRKDSVVLDFSTQPYHRLQLGSLVNLSWEGELRSSLVASVRPRGVAYEWYKVAEPSTPT